MLRPRLLGPTPGADAAGLEVGAVGAGDKLAVRVLAREPPLQIVLFDGGIVELTGDDAYDAVPDAEALVESSAAASMDFCSFWLRSKSSSVMQNCSIFSN